MSVVPRGIAMDMFQRRREVSVANENVITKVTEIRCAETRAPLCAIEQTRANGKVTVESRSRAVSLTTHRDGISV